MAVIRVGVQAIAGSAGQGVDFDAGDVATSLSLTNQSAESVQYTTGVAWTTVAAGASATVGGVGINAFRLRKLSAGAYPAPVDVDVTAASSTALNAAEVSSARVLVSVDGIFGVGGREQTFDGAPIPDPRKRAGMSIAASTQSTSSGYLDPAYDRRIVVTLDISATTSGVTADGGQDLALFPTASAAGLRWDEPGRPFRSATSQANNSLAVIDIKEA